MFLPLGSLKEILLSPSISVQRQEFVERPKRSLQKQKQAQFDKGQTISATRNSRDDGDPDELRLKWDSKSGVFTESTSAKRRSLKFSPATQTSLTPSEEQKTTKALSASQEEEPKGDRYPQSIDTSFYTVIDDHRGEPCRPPPPSFYDCPSSSLSLRCNVFFPLIGRMYWAHVRSGFSAVSGRKRHLQASEDLWIIFLDIDIDPEVEKIILNQISTPEAFRKVAGHKGNREVLLSISRRDFRYWSEGLLNSNEILICCFSSALKLVIIGTQQKTEIADLKAWITREFFINGAYFRKMVTTSKFQINEADDVPSLGKLYDIVGVYTPVKYYLKRSLELGPYKHILFNYRQMIANAAHVLLRKQTSYSVDILRSALEVYQSLISKFKLEHSLGWFDYSLRAVSALDMHKANQNISSCWQPPNKDIICLYNSFTNEWVEFTCLEFTIQHVS